MSAAQKSRKIQSGLWCMLGILLFNFFFPVLVYAQEEGTWTLDEKGKHWQYMYSPGNPVKDSWFEYDGKEYYLDKNGNMKTGWVTDQSDGNKYYLGEDGAKCKNMFVPDGTYVGEDGTELTRFVNWRDKALKVLKKKISEKVQGEFCLTDINQDEYRDIVVTDGNANVLLAAVWDEEEEEFLLAAESSPEDTKKASLSWNSQSQSVWLITDSGDGLVKDYFLMNENGVYFEHMHRFEQDTDDWGSQVFYADGAETDETEWNRLLQEAREEAGQGTASEQAPVFYPLDKTSAEAALNQAPTQEELPLWQP